MAAKWNGQFVIDTLNIDHNHDAESFETLMGLALRKNKKRAHLLVSKVLGKHIPQKPTIIANAAHMLASMIQYSDLHKVSGLELADESFAQKHEEAIRNMRCIMDEPNHYRYINNYAISSARDFTVFGYAETATSLGALVAESLDSVYIHSTRYPLAGQNDYGTFDESHSHASVHHITPHDRSMLDDPERVIVLVDDEITTGNTVINTIKLIESETHHEMYYIATLTDLRTEEDRDRLDEFAAEYGIEFQVIALLSAELEVPSDSVSVAQPVLENLKLTPERTFQNKRGSVFVRSYVNQTKPLSIGTDHKTFSEYRIAAESVLKNLAPITDERVLVLGLEESMYFPLLVSRLIEQETDADVNFSSTTRSPVVAYDNEEYAIRTRIVYNRSDDNETSRYVYNIDDSYDRIILCTDGSEDTSNHSELIDKLKELTQTVEIAESRYNTSRLQDPLSAETGFGSYSSNDVEWLLADLSKVKLEAPTEEREEAIQNGGAHYAESLPVEYVPSDEYTALFEESLRESKTKLAEAVAVVSEQVWNLRKGRPVIVSLARAGVPVGVLMKRYIKHQKNYEASHYAISIVRGKGIDYNALNYIISKHNPEDIIFVDGWTGKGAITYELDEAIREYNQLMDANISSELAVLADPGSCVTIYGTRDDYLIPSACLNSTVSGLISRTVLNESYMSPDSYHGAKYYDEFIPADKSNEFIDIISAEYGKLNRETVMLSTNKETLPPEWSGWSEVEAICEEYGIGNVNLIKPGVGETTRVLLRRVPWKILVRPGEQENLKHVLMLAAERNVPVEEREGLSYACIGIIHPNYTKGATGFDGVSAL